MNFIQKRVGAEFIKELGLCKWAWRTGLWQLNKCLLRRDIFMRLPNGVQVRLPRNNCFAAEMYVTAADVDWGSEAILEMEMRPNGVFLDVGSHIGYYALRLCHKAAKIYAFEPDPRNVVLLRKNVAKFPHIEVVEKAVSDVPGRVPLFLSELPQLNSLAPQASHRSIMVDAITIDSIWEGLRGATKIEGIKTDIQGWDLAALKGGRLTLIHDRPIVLSEVKYDGELVHFLTTCGYGVYAVVKDRESGKKSFQRLRPGGAYLTKMLFLVPDERNGSFERRITR